MVGDVGAGVGKSGDPGDPEGDMEGKFPGTIDR